MRVTGKILSLMVAVFILLLTGMVSKIFAAGSSPPEAITGCECRAVNTTAEDPDYGMVYLVPIEKAKSEIQHWKLLLKNGSKERQDILSRFATLSYMVLRSGANGLLFKVDPESCFQIRETGWKGVTSLKQLLLKQGRDKLIELELRLILTSSSTDVNFALRVLDEYLQLKPPLENINDLEESLRRGSVAGLYPLSELLTMLKEKKPQMFESDYMKKVVDQFGLSPVAKYYDPSEEEPESGKQIKEFLSVIGEQLGRRGAAKVTGTDFSLGNPFYTPHYGIYGENTAYFPPAKIEWRKRQTQQNGLSYLLFAQFTEVVPDTGERWKERPARQLPNKEVLHPAPGVWRRTFSGKGVYYVYEPHYQKDSALALAKKPEAE